MKKWIFAIIIVIVASGIYGAYVYNKAMGKKIPKESKFVEIAKEKAKLTKVKSVDYYNGKSAYIVVQGTDEKGEQLIVWVPEKKGNTVVRKKSEGISEKEAIQRTLEQVGNESKESKSKPKEIMKVKLGFENDVPLWEVTYIDDDNRYSYYYLEFKDGKFLRRYSIEK
ncbi:MULTISPECIES: cell wall elongation regulator TseB-like domain-containing protein [Bacillus cereus group]|uniref:cell wall elongation regulator TseB-like domain-containing protein n=1 Tax=Bacillus cereus group TaxID=86661 RepID=UPI00215877C5